MGLVLEQFLFDICQDSKTCEAQLRQIPGEQECLSAVFQRANGFGCLLKGSRDCLWRPLFCNGPVNISSAKHLCKLWDEPDKELKGSPSCPGPNGPWAIQI